METIASSPTSRFEVRAEIWEARNSLWVYSPTIWDVALGRHLFSFEDECWSAEKSEWIGETKVRLMLRKFPGNHFPDHLIVELDCITSTAVIQKTATVAEVNTSLACLETSLDHALTWT